MRLKAAHPPLLLSPEDRGISFRVCESQRRCGTCRFTLKLPEASWVLLAGHAHPFEQMERGLWNLQMCGWAAWHVLTWGSWNELGSKIDNFEPFVGLWDRVLGRCTTACCTVAQQGRHHCLQPHSWWCMGTCGTHPEALCKTL